MTQIAFVGNLTSPPELRFTQSGKAVANVSVAVNRKRGDVESTDFHRVTLWGELAEHSAQLDKGTRVVVIGRLESREYQNREGQKALAWEVTADAFGPDLRWATAQVTRAASQTGTTRPNQAQTDTWDTQTPPDAQADAWNTDTETPF